jgi:hypothetical protein
VQQLAIVSGTAFDKAQLASGGVTSRVGTGDELTHDQLLEYLDELKDGAGTINVTDQADAGAPSGSRPGTGEPTGSLLKHSAQKGAPPAKVPALSTPSESSRIQLRGGCKPIWTRSQTGCKRRKWVNFEFYSTFQQRAYPPASRLHGLRLGGPSLIC